MMSSAPQGWECPKCGKVYAPFIWECSVCGQPTITTTGSSQPLTDYKTCEKCGMVLTSPEAHLCVVTNQPNWDNSSKYTIGDKVRFESTTYILTENPVGDPYFRPIIE